MEVALTIVVLGMLVFLAHLLTLLFNRTKIPDVLFLSRYRALSWATSGRGYPSQIWRSRPNIHSRYIGYYPV